MTSNEPEEPTFASPTPLGSLPTPGLDAVSLPAMNGRTPDARPTDAPATDAGHDAPGHDTTEPDTAGRQRVRRRAQVAVAGLLVIAMVMTGTVLGVQAARQSAWEPLPAELPAPQDAQAVQLVLGSCVESLPDDGPVGRVRVVPCAEPHEAQVVGRVDADPDAVWPGGDTVAARGGRSCGTELLGSAAREAADELTFVVWAPSEQSWDAGDRTTLCIAAGAAPRTGSLLG